MRISHSWLVTGGLTLVALSIALISVFVVREFRHVHESLADMKRIAVSQEAPAHTPTIAQVDPQAEAKRQRWSAVQAKAQNAVLQVFAESAEFNWVEPYKTPTQTAGRGSAFFISDKGDIMTNAHVVDQAISVMIQLPAIGKRRFPVEVVGVNPERDLALMKLADKEIEHIKKALGSDSLPYLTFGDSDVIQRGDKLMALGFPLGQEGLKSTTGVVSGREQMSAAGSLIQISAPINPGNSGGPSLDSSGRVIGVNSSGVLSAQNVGYVIPSNDVLQFLDQLETTEKPTDAPKVVRKPFLGVFYTAANDNLREYLNNPEPGGLYIVDVYKGSLFDTAGIKGGDMLYAIDGYSVDMHGEMVVPWSADRITFTDYISRHKLGHELKMTYYRSGKQHTTSFVLEISEPPIRRMYPGLEQIDYDMLAGFVFMPITLNHVMLLSKYAPHLMLYADPSKPIEPALLITHIMLNSPASRLRTLTSGGIISEINGKKIQTLDDFRIAALESARTGYFTLKTRDNQFAVIPLEDILRDEERLSRTYFYPLSDLFGELKKAASQKA